MDGLACWVGVSGWRDGRTEKVGSYAREEVDGLVHDEDRQAGENKSSVNDSVSPGRRIRR